MTIQNTAFRKLFYIHLNQLIDVDQLIDRLFDN